MKNLLLLLVMSLFMVQGINAQTTSPVSEKMVVNVSDLTPEQVEALKEKERLRTMEEKVQTYGKWVGIGNEVGIAVKEALSAVVDVADDFGNTKVGQFTLIMVAWKVMGQDLVRIFIGIIFMIICTVVCIRSLRNYFPRKIMKKGYSRLMFWKEREYEIINPGFDEGTAFMKILWTALLMGSYGFTYLIMFG